MQTTQRRSSVSINTTEQRKKIGPAFIVSFSVTCNKLFHICVSPNAPNITPATAIFTPATTIITPATASVSPATASFISGHPIAIHISIVPRILTKTSLVFVPEISAKETSSFFFIIPLLRDRVSLRTRLSLARASQEAV